MQFSHLLGHGYIQGRSRNSSSSSRSTGASRAEAQRRTGLENESPVRSLPDSRVQALLRGRYKGDPRRDAAVAISVPRGPVGVLAYDAKLSGGLELRDVTQCMTRGGEEREEKVGAE